MVLIGSEVGLVAQNTLPGDTLYPVKTKINEKIESLVAVGPKSDAEVYVKQIDRKLKEAGKLSDSGKLTTDTSKLIKDQFAEKVLATKNELDKLSQSGDEETAKSISVDLKKLINEGLKSLKQNPTDEKQDLSAFIKEESEIGYGDMIDEENIDYLEEKQDQHHPQEKIIKTKKQTQSNDDDFSSISDDGAEIEE